MAFFKVCLERERIRGLKGTQGSEERPFRFGAALLSRRTIRGRESRIRDVTRKRRRGTTHANAGGTAEIFALRSLGKPSRAGRFRL